MNRYLKILGLGLLLSLPWVGASAQQANQYWCTSSTVPCPPSGWTPASATNPMPVAIESGGGTPGAGSQPYNYTPLTPGQYGLTVATSTALTIPTGALQSVVCVSGANVNYTYDGTTTPTASVGMPLLTGQCIAFSGPLILAALRFIQQSATATLNVSYTK